jgi:hypothetical protein
MEQGAEGYGQRRLGVGPTRGPEGADVRGLIGRGIKPLAFPLHAGREDTGALLHGKILLGHVEQHGLLHRWR